MTRFQIKQNSVAYRYVIISVPQYLWDIDNRFVAKEDISYHAIHNLRYVNRYTSCSQVADTLETWINQVPTVWAMSIYYHIYRWNGFPIDTWRRASQPADRSHTLFYLSLTDIYLQLPFDTSSLSPHPPIKVWRERHEKKFQTLINRINNMLYPVSYRKGFCIQKMTVSKHFLFQQIKINSVWGLFFFNQGSPMEF